MLKRLLGGEEEGDGGSFLQPEPKRPRPMLHAMREVMGAQSMQRHLEPFLRRVVQEEVHNALHRHIRSGSSFSKPPINQIQAASGARRYRLRFQSKLPDTLYTGSKIESEDKQPIHIVIIDTHLNEVVRSGPLSSVKIDILVLDGDFEGGDGQEDWTEEEFTESVVREREGKRPLLTGELAITLSNGEGKLGDAVFTDNSSWIRSRKFRLGARVSQGKCTARSVHEAISEAFLVKDHRGELYKKHHPPSLDDEVWRLEKIGKDGAFHKRLAENGIRTVQDFLKAWVVDQTKLRNLLGNGMSNKIWETTLEHAKECDVGDKIYSYCDRQGVLLLFNSIFQLVGAMIDGDYHPVSNVTPSQKVIVNKWMQMAYENQNDMVELTEPMIPRPLPPIDTNPAPGSSLLGSQLTDIPPRQHDIEPAALVEFHHQQHDPYNAPLEDISRQRDVIVVPDLHPHQRLNSLQNNSINIKDLFDVQFSDSLADLCNSGLLGPMTPAEHLLGYNTEANMLNSSLPVAWDQESGDEISRGYHLPRVSRRNSSAKWAKLVAALKWISISKRLAARRARIVHLGYPTLVPSIGSNALGVGGVW